MAAGKSYLTKHTHRYLPTERDNANNSDPIFEFDEADVWTSNNGSPIEFKKSIPSSRKLKKKVEKHDWESGVARSLPLNIPDWSKIYRDNRKSVNDDDDGGDDDGDDDADVRKVPPHEYLARQLRKTQIASFSVHEGRGRTLKGRDLSRVRDAIWEKTGFED